MTGTCFFRGTGVNCTTELPLGAVIKWFNWLTCALHGNYVWLRFNISPVSSEHKGTQTGTTRARTQNCSLSLSPHKRLGTPAVQMTTFGAVKTAELFGQKLIDRILLFGFWRKLPVAQWMRGNRFVCVPERPSIPPWMLCVWMRWCRGNSLDFLRISV